MRGGEPDQAHTEEEGLDHMRIEEEEEEPELMHTIGRGGTEPPPPSSHSGYFTVHTIPSL